MHWLTAIFGFLTIYSLYGVVYALFALEAPRAAENIRFWAIGVIVFLVATLYNEYRARRKKKAAATARAPE